jgi:hypothetical protein
MKYKIGDKRSHTKASEVYLSVTYEYPGSVIIDWDVPIEYRRTGTHLLESTDEEMDEFLTNVGEICNPANWNAWKSEQDIFWDTEKSNSAVTRKFFDALSNEFAWCSVQSDFPANPNWARRTQDLKELGYTIATKTMLDSKTQQNCTHLQLLPLPRYGVTGYETWSPKLRSRIVSVLNNFDVYEARKVSNDSLLPDHKFPEIRWDTTTKRDSLEDLSEQDIIDDFQLITNQRNLQKREACRACYQTGVRQFPMGINHFYSGSRDWPIEVPIRGPEAKKGCFGCGWFDLEQWRQSINKKLSET